MKLSEAIRKGIKMDGPQCHGSFFRILQGRVAGCCALGAAALGAGFDPLADHFPGRESATAVFLRENFTLEFTDWKDKIVRMNDYESKTREEIADWLEEQGA